MPRDTVKNSDAPTLKKRNHRPQFDLVELAKKPFLNRFEFACYLGVAVKTIDDRLGSVIPFFKVGDRVLIDRAKAIAALEKTTGRGSNR